MTPQEFVEMVARLVQDGEDDGSGEAFEMTADDAFETLATLIDSARYIVEEQKASQ